jgi:hypothetical protein
MAGYLFPLLIVSLFDAVVVGQFAEAPDNRALRFDVTDSRESITQHIDATLRLRALRIPHTGVAHFGWEIQVVEGPAGDSGRNILRSRSFSGGPHPSDVLAWLSRRRYFPDERTLPVPGYPYEIRIRLIDCRTEQIGEDIGFVSGRVEVGWRRLDVAERRESRPLTRSAATR